MSDCNGVYLKVIIMLHTNFTSIKKRKVWGEKNALKKWVINLKLGYQTLLPLVNPDGRI